MSVTTPPVADARSSPSDGARIADVPRKSGAEHSPKAGSSIRILPAMGIVIRPLERAADLLVRGAPAPCEPDSPIQLREGNSFPPTAKVAVGCAIQLGQGHVLGLSNGAELCNVHRRRSHSNSRFLAAAKPDYETTPRRKLPRIWLDPGCGPILSSGLCAADSLLGRKRFFFLWRGCGRTSLSQAAATARRGNSREPS